VEQKPAVVASDAAHEHVTYAEFEQCAWQIHVLARQALREFAQYLEACRKLAEQQQEENVHQRAAVLRSPLTAVLRGVTAGLGAVSITASLAPAFTQRCFGFLSKAIRDMSPADAFKTLTQHVAIVQDFSRAGFEIKSNFDKASTIEYEAEFEKNRNLVERRTKEEHERRSDSNESLQALQQQGKERDDTFRAVAGRM
jgi:hypothetical protein